MKSMSAVALTAALLSRSSLSDSSSDSAKTVPSLRGGGMAPTSSSSLQEEGRKLQRPYQTCYLQESIDDFDPYPVPCNATFLAKCNHTSVCVGDLTHAINYGSLSCTTFTVWNNEDDDCPWAYRCCN
jgi:hypothetical protein